MPDLESRITDWRRAMKRGGINSHDELDELESHLRDAIEHHRDIGAEPDRAFVLAADRIGAPRELRDEFQKIQSHRVMNTKIKARLIEFLVVVALVAVQLALLLPVVHKWKAHEAFLAWDVAILAGWLLLVVGGAIVFAKKRRLKA